MEYDPIVSSYYDSPSRMIDLRELNLKKQKRATDNFDVPFCSRSLERTVVQWTPERMNFVRDFFREKKYPFRFYDFSSTYEVFRKELKLFAVSLDAYYEVGGLIPLDDLIFFGSTGPEYTKVLKNFRQDCFHLTISATSFKKQEDIPDYKRYNLTPVKIRNIDLIFPYRFCIFWEEEIDDTKFYKIPLETNSKIVETFRNTLNDVIKDIPKSDYDPRLEVLMDLTTKKSLIEGKRKPFLFRPLKKKKKIEEYFSRSFQTSERCIVPVYPGGYRDSIVCTPDDISTVKLIERITVDLLKHFPYQMYTVSGEELTREVHSSVKMRAGDRTFLCRDIEKEGLTKPRYLLKIMLEGLAKVNPILLPYVDFYETFNIKDFESVRGHGLGMANALTTLMQSIICSMIDSEIQNRGFPENSFDFLVYNDDFLAIMPCDLRDEYWDVEGEIFKGLGLLRKDQKSFWSDVGGVFCEIYSVVSDLAFTEKRTSLRRTVLLSFCFDYIFEAKEFISSLGSGYKQILDEYLPEIVSYWGYEFFKGEEKYPHRFGGWFSSSFLGFNIDFSIFNFHDYNNKVYAAWKACKKKFYMNRRKDREKYSIFLNQIIPEFDEIKNAVGIGNDEVLKNRYHVYQLNTETSLRWRRFISTQRRAEYDLVNSKFNLTFLEFKREFFEDDKRNIYPYEEINWIEPDLYVRPLGDPYRLKTPLRNFLLYHGYSFSSDNQNHFKEDYSILTYQSKSERSTVGKEFDLPNFLINEDLENYGINKRQHEIDDKEIVNLNNIIYAIQRLYGCDYYPLLDDRFRDPQIERKKSKFFGRMLSLEEQIKISTDEINQSEMRVIISWEKVFKNFEQELNEDDYEFLAQEIENRLEIVDKSSESSEEDSDFSSEEEFVDYSIEIDMMRDKLLGEKKPIQELKTFEEFLQKDRLFSSIQDATEREFFDKRTETACDNFNTLFSLYYHKVELLPTYHIDESNLLIRRLKIPEQEDLKNLVSTLYNNEKMVPELAELFGIEVVEEDQDWGGMFD